MEDGEKKSCWGVTVRAVIGIAGLMLLVWLFTGAHSSAAVFAAG